MNSKFFILCLSTIVFLSACASNTTKKAQSLQDTILSQHSNWHRIALKGSFSFVAPKDLIEQSVQGIDSYVGLYKSKTMRLVFDYGAHSFPAEKINTVVSSLPAEIRILKNRRLLEKVQYSFYASLAFEDKKDESNRLSMEIYFSNPDESKIVKTILNSVALLEY